MVTAIEEQAKHSNDEVQTAADMADGKMDNLAAEPETDVQQIIHGLEHHGWDVVEGVYAAARVIGTRGVCHGDAEDWARLALLLGPRAMDAAKAVAAVIAPLL